MIRVRTPSRLHFGLFSLPAAQTSSWLNQEGNPTLPRRHFGGVGLMVDQPRLELAVAKAETWSADGPQAERALRFARTYCASAGIQGSFRLTIASAVAEHTGLGTGTQLGLAVARAIAECTGQPDRAAVTLARQVGRGLRSALGVHGFEHGGFLVEGGKMSDKTISPLLVRSDFPENWRIMLITPRNLQGAHGQRETDAFAGLAEQERDDRTTETMCRIVLLGMLPALHEHDLDTFGEALYDFNRRAGEMFQPAQGGVYAHPRIEHIITSVRAAGVKGVGQSSWGPAIFAVASQSEAMVLGNWLTRKGGIHPGEIIVTQAWNHGADVMQRH